MDSYFTRSDTGEGVRFDITPAGYPSAGCMGMPVLVGSGAIALFTITNPLLVLAWPLLAILAWMSWKIVKEGKAETAARQPQSVFVTKQGIIVDGRTFPASDVVEIAWSPRNTGPAQHYVVPDSNMQASAQAMGRNLRARMEHVSWMLSLRLRSDSRPVVIVRHLTPDTAKALGNDIMAALRP